MSENLEKILKTEMADINPTGQITLKDTPL